MGGSYNNYGYVRITFHFSKAAINFQHNYINCSSAFSSASHQGFVAFGFSNVTGKLWESKFSAPLSSSAAGGVLVSCALGAKSSCN